MKSLARYTYPHVAHTLIAKTRPFSPKSSLHPRPIVGTAFGKRVQTDRRDTGQTSRSQTRFPLQKQPAP
ncbi:hypothetical protein [Kingella denitrificans]|uniref:hypothetical protein n=1 Tax=Kingella denitrificans TaxID=502 RepID=UPI0028892E64|nr:hypothetical protein [Kingella denitrificans]